MKFSEPGIYHIYNRGNNRQKIFFNPGNYQYFLLKCRHFLVSCCRIQAWCLMPNHFHFLIEVGEAGLAPVRIGGNIMPAISNAFRLMQSSYSLGVNRQQNRTGNLFQQKTKSKLVSGENDYTQTAFRYIHQNPVEAKLVKMPGDWPYSSWREYWGEPGIRLCRNGEYWLGRKGDASSFSEEDLRGIFVDPWDAV